MSIARTSSHACFAAAILVGLVSTSSAAAARRPVRTLFEIRTANVILQQYDLSCGAAALATLLNFQHGQRVSERQVALGLMGREEYLSNPDLVRVRQGFSLLDLKRYVDAQGYVGRGFGRMTLPDLVQHAPALVPLNLGGFNHFVVFRGIVGDRVLLADPAYGNRAISADKFEYSWVDIRGMGRVAFVIGRRDGLVPPNRLVPDPREIVFAR